MSTLTLTKASEQYSAVKLFIALYTEMVLTFKPVNEKVKCLHSNESY